MGSETVILPPYLGPPGCVVPVVVVPPVVVRVCVVKVVEVDVVTEVDVVVWVVVVWVVVVWVVVRVAVLVDPHDDSSIPVTSRLLSSKTARRMKITFFMINCIPP